MAEKSMEKTIVATGDINPCRDLAAMLKRQDLTRKRLELSSLFTNADLVVGKLEGPITAGKNKRAGQVWNLHFPPELAPLLSVFDGFSLSNNHVFDYGLGGFADTVETLDAMDIQHCGAGRTQAEAAEPARFNLDGFKVSMTGLTDRNWLPSSRSSHGTHVWRGTAYAGAIGQLAESSDFVIVHLHHGYEFMDFPGPEEIQLANKVIGAGADLVLGHHSHYLMGVTRKGTSAIAYGLGDFLLDKMHMPGKYRKKARRGALFQFKIAKHEVLDWRIIPIITDTYGWPAPAPDQMSPWIVEYVQTLSRLLENEKHALSLFKHQAAENMLPYAIQLLNKLLVREGLHEVLLRLKRIRRVDLIILFSYLETFLKRRMSTKSVYNVPTKSI